MHKDGIWMEWMKVNRTIYYGSKDNDNRTAYQYLD